MRRYLDVNSSLHSDTNIWKILTQSAHLYTVANGTEIYILQQITGQNCVKLIAAVSRHHPSHRPCFLDLRWCNVVFAYNKRKKYMSISVLVINICWILQCNCRRLEESEGYNCFFIVSCVFESKYISSSA